MSDGQRDYYLRRAAASLAQAQAAHDPSVAAIHQDLHKRYLILAAGLPPSRPIARPAAIALAAGQRMGLPG